MQAHFSPCRHYLPDHADEQITFMPYTHVFQEILRRRPNTPLLNSIDSPAQLRLLSEDQLERLCYELRAFYCIPWVSREATLVPDSA